MRRLLNLVKVVVVVGLAAWSIAEKKLDCHGNGQRFEKGSRKGQCLCFPGFTGLDCETHPCSTHGILLDDNTCFCDKGHQGTRCEFIQCKFGKRNSTDNTCICINARITGTHCTTCANGAQYPPYCTFRTKATTPQLSTSPSLTSSARTTTELTVVSHATTPSTPAEQLDENSTTAAESSSNNWNWPLIIFGTLCILALIGLVVGVSLGFRRCRQNRQYEELRRRQEEGEENRRKTLARQANVVNSSVRLEAHDLGDAVPLLGSSSNTGGLTGGLIKTSASVSIEVEKPQEN